MRRSSLENLPSHSLPEGYTFRWYQPGDEELWVAVQAAADQFNTISMELFDAQFGKDEAALAERQFLLMNPEDEAVGAMTAWYGHEAYGREWGRIHWVAIVPEYRHRGLAKPLLSRACHRLRELGHEKAYLTTSSARVPAINLYLSFDFQPHLQTHEDRKIWLEMTQHLRYSYEL